MIKDSEEWAQSCFGNADLGDKRLTTRLVKVSGHLAANIGASVVQASGDSASIEGAYRLMRNNKVVAADIAEAGFNALLPKLEQSKTILALEDTTTLSYKHNVAKQLGYTGTNPNDKTRGMLVHSVLMVDADTEQTIGLGEQHRWCRDDKDFGKKHKRGTRKYEDKESYKWQNASEAMAKRYAPVMERIISVCDRESDIFEYINYKRDHQQRFVVRVMHDRKVEEANLKVGSFINTISPVGTYQVDIQQKGGKFARPARTATVAIRYAQVTLRAPRDSGLAPITLNLISCDEVSAPDSVEPLQWRLYTTEPVDSMESALKIVRFYELRWRVEEFHKAWKSAGTKVEDLRLQTLKNLEKMVVITAFVCIRLLELRELVNHRDKQKAKTTCCEQFFSKVEWQLLWVKTEKGNLPKNPPSIYWAYYALAKLGKWYDSKRTGRVGWNALWDGWFRLAESLTTLKQMHLITAKI